MLFTLLDPMKSTECMTCIRPYTEGERWIATKLPLTSPSTTLNVIRTSNLVQFRGNCSPFKENGPKQRGVPNEEPENNEWQSILCSFCSLPDVT